MAAYERTHSAEISKGAGLLGTKSGAFYLARDVQASDTQRLTQNAPDTRKGYPVFVRSCLPFRIVLSQNFRSIKNVPEPFSERIRFGYELYGGDSGTRTRKSEDGGF